MSPAPKRSLANTEIAVLIKRVPTHLLATYVSDAMLRTWAVSSHFPQVLSLSSFHMMCAICVVFWTWVLSGSNAFSVCFLLEIQRRLRLDRKARCRHTGICRASGREAVACRGEQSWAAWDWSVQEGDSLCTLASTRFSYMSEFHLNVRCERTSHLESTNSL